MPVGDAKANRKPIPRRAWMSGFVLSFAMCGLVVLAFPMLGPAPITTYVVPPMLVVLAAFAFASIWPVRPWFWGAILSSGFWAYFLVVFIAYLSISQWDGILLVRALLVLLAGIGGAFAGARMRRAPRVGQIRD